MVQTADPQCKISLRVSANERGPTRIGKFRNCKSAWILTLIRFRSHASHVGLYGYALIIFFSKKTTVEFFYNFFHARIQNSL